MLGKLTSFKNVNPHNMTEESLVSTMTSSTSIREQHRSLSEVLQTTLDIEQLLSLYACHIREHFNVVSLQVITDDQVFTLISHHQNPAYEHATLLYADNHYLGQVRYGLKTPLTTMQKRRLEHCHQQLAFPLFNSMRFADVRQQAVRDHLTHLGNRNLLEEVIEHLCLQVNRRPRLTHTVMLLDLDGFKRVNDKFGHAVGDDILRHYAQLLKRVVRDTDQVFRFGGDEFILVLENTPLEDSESVYQRIQRAMTLDSELNAYQLATSAGAVLINVGEHVESVIAAADEQLYHAKAAGKNCLYTPTTLQQQATANSD
ncbi:GGDEF domain-containing protein [Idiomarina tyrosinivorans]|nr:GGDEF domain-containing protein [Idiomarina tyrosinivorans]